MFPPTKTLWSGAVPVEHDRSLLVVCQAHRICASLFSQAVRLPPLSLQRPGGFWSVPEAPAHRIVCWPVPSPGDLPSVCSSWALSWCPFHSDGNHCPSFLGLLPSSCFSSPGMSFKSSPVILFLMVLYSLRRGELNSQAWFPRTCPVCLREAHSHNFAGRSLWSMSSTRVRT